MSLFAKIRCVNCNGAFELYHRALQEEAPARCPHCYTQMTEKQWRGLVDCFHGLQDWNAQNRKSHEEHGAPGFAAEIRRHYVPAAKFRHN